MLKAYIIPFERWTGENIGQFGEKQIVIETEIVPDFECANITESEIKFTQRVFDGNFGKEMAYSEFCQIRGLINSVGEDAIGAKSVEELEYRKKQKDYITQLELALVDLYEGSL